MPHRESGEYDRGNYLEDALSDSEAARGYALACQMRRKTAKCGRAVYEVEARAIEAAFLKAYRWQYIHSGVRHPHFGEVLNSLISEAQGRRIQAALATLQ